MPAPKRSRREPTDNWEQLRLFAAWPEQERYELLRPIVLFGQTAGERSTVTYEEDSLAQYQVAYEPDGRHIRDLTEPRLFPNRFPSLQLLLWDAPEIEWHLVERLPPYQARRKHPTLGVQQHLFPAKDGT